MNKFFAYLSTASISALLVLAGFGIGYLTTPNDFVWGIVKNTYILGAISTLTILVLFRPLFLLPPVTRFWLAVSIFMTSLAITYIFLHKAALGRFDDREFMFVALAYIFIVRCVWVVKIKTGEANGIKAKFKDIVAD